MYEERGGRLVGIRDRTYAIYARLEWSAGSELLVRLTIDGAVVDGRIHTHPLLGAAHLVAHTNGDTAMTALTWSRPAEIPAIAEPGRLPLGAGSAILNTIAVLAQRAGVASLRYAGPYPTSALWRTLARSFRTTANEASFIAGAPARALRVARDPIAIDFAPAPHERLAIAGGFVELRDRVERAVIAGVAYEPEGSPARLVADTEHLRCEIWFGDAPYAHIATVALDGSLLAGPHAIPASRSPVLGRDFPPALRSALGELVADAVPPPLADAARAILAAEPLHWADLGPRAAREQPTGFAVHAALWDHIAPLGLPRLALALAEALAPVVTTALIRRATAPTA
jgi:hypothetical protein